MKKIRLTLSVSILLFTLSCNSADNTNQAATTEQKTTTTPAATEIKDDVSQKNVVQIALGSKDHTTLVAALKQAELVEPLEKSGPFTVFAPTNAAFDKLPKGTVEGLMKADKKDALADILQYHVSVGVFKEDMLQDGQTIGQVNSQNITISKKDGKIKINGTANIVGTIVASNGIIYVIDEVLLPPKK